MKDLQTVLRSHRVVSGRVAIMSATAVSAENASPHDATTHLGLVMGFAGPRAYHTGDNREEPDSYADRLGPARDLALGVSIVPVNQGYNNTGTRVQLAWCR